jgi:hypothetical protein
VVDPIQSSRAGRLQAHSISRTVLERLEAGPTTGRVLASFERACILETAAGQLVALVAQEIGDGPLNVVVEPKIDPASANGAFGNDKLATGPTFSGQPDTPARLESIEISVGETTISLKGATVWEPRPAWEQLRIRRQVLTEGLPLVQATALAQAPEGSLLDLLRDAGGIGANRPRRSMDLPLLYQAHRGAQDLAAGWAGDRERFGAGMSQLAGLGTGLTPAGDDFLVGVMLRAWLAHPEPASFCRSALGIAQPRTTKLSAAFLGAAARGECGAPWHRLLAALEQGPATRLREAVGQVLSSGHSSGADALAGFLWIERS